jgi:DNA segregation ATPase FtsK/SpoIIIE-like protein
MPNLIKNRLKSENYKYYKKEIACVTLSAIFIFLAISLISYNAGDNSLFHFSNANTNTANWCGFLGANFAALFFYIFGHAAYLFLLSLAGIIVLLLKSTTINNIKSKIVSIITFFISATSIMSILDLKLNLIFSGGVFGALVSKALEWALGPKGSVITLITVAWISMNWFLEISMLPIIKDLTSNLLLALKTATVSSFKFLFSKIRIKKQPSATFQPSLQPSASSSADIEYWKNLLENGIAQKAANSGQAGQAQDQTQAHTLDPKLDITSQIIQRFADKELNKASRKIALGKAKLILLPNTVLSKNIFAKNSATCADYTCAYQEILSTQAQASKNAQKEFVLPDPEIFASKPQSPETEQQKEQAQICSKKLVEKLLCFGVKGTISSIKPGPVITMFEYKPEIDSKISKITAVEDDLAMALTAKSIRILAPIPGKNVVGFEISNLNRNDVFFGDVAKSQEFEKFSGTHTGGTHAVGTHAVGKPVSNPTKLPLILGVDVTGKPAIEDLCKMPHLLVGGATGSGKSVGLNAMIISLLCSLNPDQLKLILIDPKRLEFGPYADIPHLLFPVVTNASTAISVLKWVVQEMENRYQNMATVGVRNINEYNALPEIETLPFIVVVIDELADLMMVAGKDVETQIVRIAQMARAAGIHMMVATQRPSVEVVTGLIKVNFPSRISFRVSSKIDSRTILDSQGAEKLLGRGDMLYMNSSSPDLMRVHGVYVSDEEIKKVVDCWKMQQEPNYLNLNEALKVIETNNKLQDLDDEIYGQVLEFLKTTDEVSISLIQRYFRIGFNRSARLIEKLEMDGIVAPAQGSKSRKVIR